MPQNPNSPLNCGKSEVVFGETFDGKWKTPSGGLPSLKIWEGSDKTGGDIRGAILAFEISDITYSQMLEAFKENSSIRDPITHFLAHSPILVTHLLI